MVLFHFYYLIIFRYIFLHSFLYFSLSCWPFKWWPLSDWRLVFDVHAVAILIGCVYFLLTHWLYAPPSCCFRTRPLSHPLPPLCLPAPPWRHAQTIWYSHTNTSVSPTLTTPLAHMTRNSGTAGYSSCKLQTHTCQRCLPLHLCVCVCERECVCVPNVNLFKCTHAAFCLCLSHFRDSIIVWQCQELSEF